MPGAPPIDADCSDTVSSHFLTRESGYGWRTNFGHVWMMCHNHAIPPNAVPAGRDKDGAPIFAGRAYHEGDLLPAKVVSSHRDAYVCWGGQEIAKSEFEVSSIHPVALRATWQ